MGVERNHRNGEAVAREGQTSPPRSGVSRDAAPLEFRHVSKRYPGAEQTTLNDISFALPAGEICVLVGPSGCGKTTAMRMINRMVEITEGDILLDGRSVSERNPAELRREIGYVIQQVGLFPHLTIADNIGTVPRLLGWDKQRLHARVEELRELIGLPPETMGRYPAQLSGGQRQRVGVARALAADPPLMLMDEPFGAIDPITRTRLQDEFLRLQREIRKTIVFVTHDIDEAVKMGDRIAIFNDHGKLAQYDSPDELLARPADDFVAQFVGVDRGLKRLTLSTLADIELIPAHCVRSPAEAPPGAEPWTVVLVDNELLPTGRLDPSGALVSLGPTASIETSLRDALSLIMSDANRPLVTVGADGSVAGLARLELIAAELGPEHDVAGRAVAGATEEKA